MWAAYVRGRLSLGIPYCFIDPFGGLLSANPGEHGYPAQKLEAYF
jgi:hypothetical protein